MNQRFLYFLPNVMSCPDLKKIRAFKLEHAFPTQGAYVQTFDGPDGQNGALIAFGDGDLCHKPVEQVWVKTNSGAYVGMWRDKARQPGPANLRRDDAPMEGYPVFLADDNEWVVPILRFLNGDTRFPRALKMDADGNAEYVIRDEFREIFNLADDMVHASLKGEGRKFSPNDHMRLAVEALRVNYRVGPYELSLLNVIDSENVKNIADAALDGPNLRALLDEIKKKQTGESGRGPGSETGAAA